MKFIHWMSQMFKKDEPIVALAESPIEVRHTGVIKVLPRRIEKGIVSLLQKRGDKCVVSLTGKGYKVYPISRYHSYLATAKIGRTIQDERAKAKVIDNGNQS